MNVIDALAKACETRPAEDGDAVQGVVPSYVAAPASVAEAAELMRAAAEHELAVVPRGAGTKLRWGAPPERCDLVVETRRLDRVIEHAAGDLVVKVEAGLSLDDLQDVLAGTDQQLALDGLLPGATVGGVVADRHRRAPAPAVRLAARPAHRHHGDPRRRRGRARRRQGRQERRGL